MSYCTGFKCIGTVIYRYEVLIERHTVPYCTVSVRSRAGYATFGTVPLCTVSRIKESGTVSQCTELERIGTITTNSEICDLLRFGSKSKCGLLSAVGEIELIFRVSVYND